MTDDELNAAVAREVMGLTAEKFCPGVPCRKECERRRIKRYFLIGKPLTCSHCGGAIIPRWVRHRRRLRCGGASTGCFGSGRQSGARLEQESTEPSEKSLQRARKVLDDWNAGWSWVDGQVQDQLLAENQRMAALIAAAIDEAVRKEREACVRIAERDGSSHTQIGPPSGLIESKVRAQIATADRIAAAIRARSEHD